MIATWMIAAALSAATIAPDGDAKAVKAGRYKVFAVRDGAMSFVATGPGSVIFDVLGNAKTRGKTLDLQLSRDTHFTSSAKVKMLKVKSNKAYPFGGRFAVDVPEGEHTYVVSVAGKIAMGARAVAKVPKRVARASAEADNSPKEEVAVADETAPKEEEATSTESQSADMNQLMASTDEAAKKIGAETPVDDGVNKQVVKAMRVAVYDLTIEGVDPTIGRVVTDSLLAEVRKLQGVSAIGMDEIRDMLSFEADKQMLGCESNESCMAEIAGALGVDYLVTGKLTQVSDGSVFLVRRIEQSKAQVVGVVDRRLETTKTGEEYLAVVGPSIEELFAEVPLRDGAERGVADEVALRLNPPPLPKWPFWVVAGTALAAAAAGGTLGALAKVGEADFQDLAATGTPENPVDGARLTAIGDTAESYALGSNASFGTAGGLAIAAGIMALFTDWKDYRKLAEAK